MMKGFLRNYRNVQVRINQIHEGFSTLDASEKAKTIDNLREEIDKCICEAEGDARRMYDYEIASLIKELK